MVFCSDQKLPKLIEITWVKKINRLLVRKRFDIKVDSAIQGVARKIVGQFWAYGFRNFRTWAVKISSRNHLTVHRPWIHGP